MVAYRWRRGDENPSEANASERRLGFERTIPVNHGHLEIRNPEEDFCSLAQRERGRATQEHRASRCIHRIKMPEEAFIWPA